MNSESNILFYDSECGLCHQTIQFLEPRTTDLYFSPINGSLASELLSGKTEELTGDLGCMLLWSQDEVYTKSDAFLLALTYGNSFSCFFVTLRLLPKSMRDFCYDFIAHLRKKVIKAKRCESNLRLAQRLIK